MNIPERDALVLSRFAKTNPEIAETIVKIFKNQREKCRDTLEVAENSENLYREQGRARAFKEASELFDTAWKIAEKARERRGRVAE